MRVAFCALAVALGCSDHGRYSDPSRTWADAGRREAGRTIVHQPPSLTGIRGTLDGPNGAPTEILVPDTASSTSGSRRHCCSDG